MRSKEFSEGFALTGVVTLNNDNVGDAKTRHAPLKSKAIAKYGDFGVCLLITIDLEIIRRFWFEEVMDLLSEQMTPNIVLMILLVI